MSRDRPKTHQPNAFRYLLFYKPYNVLCQFTDGDGRRQEAADGRPQTGGRRQKPGFDVRSAVKAELKSVPPNGVRSPGGAGGKPQPVNGQADQDGIELSIDASLSEVRQTLRDYIPVPDVYPVGRLDQDSEGLMLLTNDGNFQHRLSHPKFEHPRTYWVQVERIPDEAALQQLQTGVIIQGYRTRPALVKLLSGDPKLPPRHPPIRFRKNVPTAWLEMTLTEGRNRQVRRMTASVGFPTLRLVRVGIVDLQLTNLAPGHWRDLTANELERVQTVMRSRKP
jgi:23S rRNA pseudouridine2457 synthase